MPGAFSSVGCELGGLVAHLLALHQLDLRAVEIDGVFAVDRALADVELPSEHHFGPRFERGRRLVNVPGGDEEAEADGENGNPPAALEKGFVTMKARDKSGAPGCV